MEKTIFFCFGNRQFFFWERTRFAKKRRTPLQVGYKIPIGAACPPLDRNPLDRSPHFSPRGRGPTRGSIGAASRRTPTTHAPFSSGPDAAACHSKFRATRRQFRGRSFRRELASGALRRGMQAARRQSFAPPLGLPFLFSAVGGALFQISAKCTDYRVVYQVGALFPKKCHCQEHFARSASFSALCLAAAHPYEERRNVCMRWSQMRRLRTLS